MTIAEYALKFVGKPYVWGGDGSGKCGGGLTAPGLVLDACGRSEASEGRHDAQGPINDSSLWHGLAAGFVIAARKATCFSARTCTHHARARHR